MHVLLLKEILLLIKKHTINDFEKSNNAAANVTATKNTNNNEFGEKSWFLKIMLHSSFVYQKLMV